MSTGVLQSEPGEEPVIVEALFRASVSRVFAAWTQPDQIIKWFGPKPGSLVSADVDLRVGGKWRFVLAEEDGGRSMLQGEYGVVEPEKCLTFSWRHVREAANGAREETAKSTVTVNFEEHGAATRVRLRHEGIRQRDGRLGVGHGWETTFGHLRDILDAA